MKIKGTILAAFSVLGLSGAFAQSVEYDDMYFNSDDRAALKSQRAVELAYRTETTKNKIDEAEEATEGVNPTDSYSARNVNPEYTSRAQSQSAQAEDDDYFVNNYQYNRWNNSPWYGSNYYSRGFNSWNSPYYGYGYNSWNSPWNDPFWSYNGWSNSFSYFYGPSWSYGWGGYYNSWNRPYYGWNPYGVASLYGGGYWNNYMYPGTIFVINRNENDGREVVYGKRPTRGTVMVSDRSSVRNRSNANGSIRNDGNNSGRISHSGRQADYYDPYNNRAQRSSSSSYGSRSNTEHNRTRSWSNWDSNGGYNNGSLNRSSSPSYSPSSGNMSSGTRVNSGSSSGGRRGRD